MTKLRVDIPFFFPQIVAFLVASLPLRKGR